MASTSFDLCPPSSPDFVKPAFPVYFDKADGNATYFASFCWPTETLGSCSTDGAPSYWLASQILNAASSSSLRDMKIELLTAIQVMYPFNMFCNLRTLGPKCNRH